MATDELAMRGAWASAIMELAISNGIFQSQEQKGLFLKIFLTFFMYI